MATGDRDSSDPHASNKVNTSGEVSKIRRFVEVFLILSVASFTTSPLERILSTQVDSHSVLHHVIFISFYMSITFLYDKYKPI